MRVRLVGLALIVASLQFTLGASAATGELLFAPPLDANGAVSATLDGALYVTSDEPNPSTVVELRAPSLQVTRVTWDFETAGDPSVLLVDPPSNSEPQVDTFTTGPAELRVRNLKPNSDVLVAAGSQGTITANSTRSMTIQGHSEPFEVLDGFRRDMDARGPGARPYDFTFTVSGPHLVSEPARAQVIGSQTIYTWFADVEICAPDCQVYETGMTMRDGDAPGTYVEHWEFIVIEAQGSSQAIAPTAGALQAHARDVSVTTDGTVRLPAAQGIIEADGLTYVASGSPLVVRGTTTVDLRPVSSSAVDAASTPGRTLFAADLSGTINAINIPAEPAEDGLSPATAGALAASGVGLVAMAAYLASTRGAAILAPLLAKTRRRLGADERELEEDPLLHPDRHRVYYLLQRRGVMTAGDARKALGLRSAEEHLNVLAAHDLVKTRQVAAGGKHRTYFVFPGRDIDGRVERLVFLGEPDAERLAQLLDAHGEVDLETLVDAAVNAPPHLTPRRTRTLVDRFESMGLARRELVAGVIHVTPTQELRDCLLLRAGHRRGLVSSIAL